RRTQARDGRRRSAHRRRPWVGPPHAYVPALEAARHPRATFVTNAACWRLRLGWELGRVCGVRIAARAWTASALPGACGRLRCPARAAGSVSPLRFAVPLVARCPDRTL